MKDIIKSHLVTVIICAVIVLLVVGASLFMGIPAFQDKADAIQADTVVEEAPFEVLSFDEHHSKYGVSYRLALARDGYDIGRAYYNEDIARAHNGAINEHSFYKVFSDNKVGDTVWLRYIRGKNTGEYFFIEKVPAPELPQSSIDNGFGQ